LTSIVHRCPVCGKEHEVTRARAEMARGDPLCCGPDCEAEARLRSGQQLVKRSQIMTEAAAYVALAALLAIVLAVKWNPG
jgi:hypothetical protein